MDESWKYTKRLWNVDPRKEEVVVAAQEDVAIDAVGRVAVEDEEVVLDEVLVDVRNLPFPKNHDGQWKTIQKAAYQGR